MGFGMASNIARADIPLRVWNRSREKAEPLAELGATIVDSPAEAAEGAAVVVTMLTDTDAVIEFDGWRGWLLLRGAWLACMGTDEHDRRGWHRALR
jgi:3-hydroxyisobutyrate dehydrogenase-like beta-hydroxyacid dehydrogenase